MQIGILTFEQFHGRIEGSVGSTRIRANWLYPYWPEAENYKIGKKYDVIIYQKVYDVEGASERKDTIKILDICDPDYLHWACRLSEMIQHCDAITVGTEALRRDIANMTDKPVIIIPDRINLEFFKEKKNHAGKGKAKTVAWYGFSDNFAALETALQALIKYELKLIIISNQPYPADNYVTEKISVINYPWSEENWQRDITEADIVINPKMEHGKWEYKSNNKTLNAWALGMPVAHTEEELVKFLDEGERIKEAENRLQEIREKYDARQSVEQYKELIEKLWSEKKQPK